MSLIYDLMDVLDKFRKRRVTQSTVCIMTNEYRVSQKVSQIQIRITPEIFGAKIHWRCFWKARERSYSERVKYLKA